MSTVSGFIISELRAVVRNTIPVCITLFKMMIPIVIIVKILSEFGAIGYLALPLAPVMNLVGLPPELGLVWATGIFMTLYSAAALYASILPDIGPLTIAQVTVLGTLLAVAHNLPIESNVAKSCGLSSFFQTALRLVMAMVLGFLLKHFYSYFGLLQDITPGLLWMPEAAPDTYWEWGLQQATQLAMLCCVIFVLFAVIRILDRIGFTALLSRLLHPLLRFMGIGKNAATMGIFGITMGIMYGSGLIINEVRKGSISPKDAFATFSLMSLSHSLIEDSLILIAMGAHSSGIIWARIAFSIIVIAILMHVLWPFFHRSAMSATHQSAPDTADEAAAIATVGPAAPATPVSLTPDKKA